VDIGKPVRIVTVEPLEEPIPHEHETPEQQRPEPAPQPDQEPVLASL
jgi:hypothetical protein